MYYHNKSNNTGKWEQAQRVEIDFSALDIVAEMEQHTSTRLHPASRTGKQWVGACPYDDCSVDTDGFIVWPQLTERGCHFHCRGCLRSGDIIKLIREIKGLSFSQALDLLGLENPYHAGGGKGGSLAQLGRAGLPELPRTPLPAISAWSKEELALLTHYYPLMQRTLDSARPRAYLAQRGIPLEVAVEMGLGYIPAMSEIEKLGQEDAEGQRLPGKWCDRIIFPLQGYQGEQGFAGRALFLWDPGMDEHEHKQRLDQHNQQVESSLSEGDSSYAHTRRRKVLRWEKTSPAGYFNLACLGSGEEVLRVVEGEWDALAAIAAGCHNVVAMGTTLLDVERIPGHIFTILLGMDADNPGKSAAHKLAKTLRRKGLAVEIRLPVVGKDWSEAYRLHGIEGLAPLLAPPAPSIDLARFALTQEEMSTIAVADKQVELMKHCVICQMRMQDHEEVDFFYTPTGDCYCAQHWAFLQVVEQSNCCMCGAAATSFSPSGHMYCDTHYRCRRGHRPRWLQHPNGTWLCACYWDAPHPRS